MLRTHLVISRSANSPRLFCMWDGAYKRSLAANVVVAAGFPCPYISGPLPYVRCHINLDEIC